MVGINLIFNSQLILPFCNSVRFRGEPLHIIGRLGKTYKVETAKRIQTSEEGIAHSPFILPFRPLQSPKRTQL